MASDIVPAWRPVDPDALSSLLAERIATRPGRVRVAIDGADAARPGELAESLLEPLRVLGRPSVHIRAETFYRDASVRLEYGHTDVHSFRHDWIDHAALTREVLDPLGPQGNGRFLASLRDPLTNRATREPARQAEPDEVAIISGELLLDSELCFDFAVHLTLSAGALARRTAPARAWTLPAFADYEPEADVVIKLDDPRHPAMRGN